MYIKRILSEYVRHLLALTKLKLTLCYFKVSEVKLLVHTYRGLNVLEIHLEYFFPLAQSYYGMVQLSE